MRGVSESTDARIRRVVRAIHLHPDYRLRSDLDQCPATTATVLRRIRLLDQCSRDMLLLGDDDLLSVALAVREARKRIVVLDMDRTLLRLIRRFAPRHRIEVAGYDVRQELPATWSGRFDEVFTDPPYTVAGQLLFLHRALCALRPVTGARLYVCASCVYLTPGQIARVQGFLDRAGFELTAIYSGFNRYKAPPDVRLDLKRRGFSHTTWLDSDLFDYERRRVRSVPPVPELCEGAIYDYLVRAS